MQMALARNYTYLQNLLGELCHHICSRGLHYNQQFIEMLENRLISNNIDDNYLWWFNIRLGMTYLFKHIKNGGYFQ